MPFVQIVLTHRLQELRGLDDFSVRNIHVDVGGHETMQY